MQIDKLKDLILYQSENGNVQVEVLYDNEDFWLTQKTMAELFNVKVNTINYHLKEIFNSDELNEKSFDPSRERLFRDYEYWINRNR